MDVVFDRARGITDFPFDLNVTFNTGVFLLTAGVAVAGEGKENRGEE